MDIEELKKEYEIQGNRTTAYPIYVTVQELMPVGVISDEYSVLLDGETILACPPDCEFSCDDCEDSREICEHTLQMGYVWQDIEFFLTIKGAEEFIKADEHNHRELRIYVKHFNRRNYEINNLLKEIGFKCND
jgi:hypothetical protein